MQCGDDWKRLTGKQDSLVTFQYTYDKTSNKLLFIASTPENIAHLTSSTFELIIKFLQNTNLTLGCHADGQKIFVAPVCTY